jgi:hypothetical protein
VSPKSDPTSAAHGSLRPKRAPQRDHKPGTRTQRNGHGPPALDSEVAFGPRTTATAATAARPIKLCESPLTASAGSPLFPCLCNPLLILEPYFRVLGFHSLGLLLFVADMYFLGTTQNTTTPKMDGDPNPDQTGHVGRLLRHLVDAPKISPAIGEKEETEDTE